MKKYLLLTILILSVYLIFFCIISLFEYVLPKGSLDEAKKKGYEALEEAGKFLDILPLMDMVDRHTEKG
jgi:hypothetical protein